MQPLETYHCEAPGVPEALAIDAYQRDGVVCLKGALNSDWVDQGRRAVAAALRSRRASHEHRSHKKSGESGSFFYDVFLWKRLPSFRTFTFDSPCAELARRVMRSESLLLYFDMAIVKEPGTSARTPWHYDEAYWPVGGSQVCNVWAPLDPVPEDMALRFVPGSHRLDTAYSAIDFFSNRKKPGHALPTPPRWEEIGEGEEIAIAPMEPGDCVIFDFRMHHSAPGNLHRHNRRRVICTHWLGDGARFDDKQRACSPDERGEGLVHGGPMECDTFPRVC